MLSPSVKERNGQPGKNQSELPSLDADSEKTIDGKPSPTIELPTSEKGFGTRLPEITPHKQIGDIRKVKVCYAMLKDQQFRCFVSGVNLTPETASMDHIIPVSDGGHPVDARNCAWVHRNVNAMKGTLSLDEFVQWCKAVAEHAPSFGS